MYKSVAISAAPGAKIAQISKAKNNVEVQKQVVMDKPEINTDIEAPEFDSNSFNNNTEELLNDMKQLEINVPKPSADQLVKEVPQVPPRPKSVVTNKQKQLQK